MERQLRFRLMRSLIAVTLLIVVCAGVVESNASAQEQHQLTVHFIDVGQGLATLLAGPDFTVLVDTGDFTGNEVVPYLQSQGVTSIDLLVGTHPHADHIGQLPLVLQTFPVNEVWMNGAAHTTQTYAAALDAILASEAGYYEPRAGEVETVGSLRLEVLSPTHLTGDLNNDSLVLRAVYGDVSFLLPGDAEREAEWALLQSGYARRSTILQLGHHGSSSSSTLEFLQTVQPEFTIYSAGRNNDYGHPHDAVLQNLQTLGIPVYGTDVHGTIRIITDGQTYQVELEHDAVLTAPTQVPVPPVVEPTPAAPASAGVGCREGQIDVNSASREELDRIMHIGGERAGQILRLRPFSSVDDLIRVRGIGPVRLSDIKAQGLACVAQEP